MEVCINLILHISLGVWGLIISWTHVYMVVYYFCKLIQSLSLENTCQCKQQTVINKINIIPVHSLTSFATSSPLHDVTYSIFICTHLIYLFQNIIRSTRCPLKVFVYPFISIIDVYLLIHLCSLCHAALAKRNYRFT